MLALTLSGLGLVLSPSQGPARGKAALQKNVMLSFIPALPASGSMNLANNMNCPGRSEDSLKRDAYAPLIGTTVVMYCEESHGSGKQRLKPGCQLEEVLVPGKEISLSSGNLPDQVAGETEVKAMMDQWWVGLRFNQDCLVTHTSCPPFKHKPLAKTSKIKAQSGSLDMIFVPFPYMAAETRLCPLGLIITCLWIVA